MKALIFDTETTGLISNRTIGNDKQPWVTEFCGHLVDLKTGDVLDQFETLIKPAASVDLSKPVKGKKSISDMTGITNDMIKDAPLFKDVAPRILKLIEGAPAIMAHNLGFDYEMCQIEFERCNLVPVGWPVIRICSIEQTMHLKGYRLTLSRLYDFLFPGETFEAHRAANDVKALSRCAVEMHLRGIV